QARDDFGFGGVHALIESLDGEAIGVAIDDEGGQEVGLGVYDAVGVGVADHAAAMLFGGAKAAEVEIAVDLFDVRREHAERDLAGGRVVRCAERPSSLVGDFDRLPRLGAVAIYQVGCKDPGVAGGDAVGGLAVDADFV